MRLDAFSGMMSHSTILYLTTDGPWEGSADAGSSTAPAIIARSAAILTFRLIRLLSVEDRMPEH